jgi:hypothetical protein
MGFDRMTDLLPWGMEDPSEERPASSSKRVDEANWVRRFEVYTLEMVLQMLRVSEGLEAKRGGYRESEIVWEHRELELLLVGDENLLTLLLLWERERETERETERQWLCVTLYEQLVGSSKRAEEFTRRAVMKRNPTTAHNINL